MAVKLVIDSAADIMADQAAALDMTHVPLKVRFGEKEFRDGIDLTPKKFYEKLIESDTLPVTSQVVPSEFEDVFKELTANGDEVVCITLSSALSGTYASARMAAEDFPGKVFVVDSLSATLGERIIIDRARVLVKEGKSASEIAEILDHEKHRVKLLAVLDTLEYLKKGGRISSTVAFAGALLAIKPAITLKDGAVELCGKARGSKNMNNLLRKMIEEGPGIDFTRPLCTAYSGFSDSMLRKYIEDSKDLWQTDVEDVPKMVIGSVIGTHVGPNVIAVAYFEKEN